MDNFAEIALLLVLAAALGAVGLKLRQPLIIMFLAVGILAGPSGLGIIESYSQIELLAHIGIALLLFIVGLRLDINLIRTIGPVALATGLGQIIFTSAIGFVIALLMGMPVISAVYVAVALTFSSTIIIVKLLSDKKEIDSLHGQIAVGFLIVQDIAAIVALIILTTFRPQAAAEHSPLISTFLIAVKGLLFFGCIGLLMRFILPRLRRLAQSPETLLLFAVAWAVFLAAVSEWLGFSKEVGAFMAGVSLASTEYRDSISSRLSSLRDFLLLFFFIDLGARLEWSTVGAGLTNAVIFSLFVLIGNPLIVLIIMGLMGYRRRTSFLAGLTVAQISEFSLIVAAMGVSLGHIPEETMGLITLVGVTTIFVSTYMILYSGPLYRLLAGPLKLFERKNPYRETVEGGAAKSDTVDVILFGLGNYGSGLAEHLLERRKSFIGVDFDPTVLDKWRRQGIPVLYGDLGDPDLHEQLPLDRARWVVSAIRSRELNLTLLGLLKHRGYTGKIALTAVNEKEAKLYEKQGAQVVFRPFHDAAEQAVDALTQAMELLTSNVNWPAAFSEIRLRPGSAYAGQTIRSIPLRAQTGASILAVSRAGTVHYDPGADFQVFPGDRLVIVGTPEQLARAQELLNHFPQPPAEEEIRFVMDQLPITENSPQAGQTLADLQFRVKYNVTVIGICRGEQKITSPGPNEKLSAGDRLIIIGTAQAVSRLKNSAPASA
ncbi:MAG TPA: cation:proton antiporter [Anaerohalosphaeraceae bacterium]|nr:cation:proton antiporter [Anaerohalosphaeraceae bacterium]HOL30939.1 cation:proton antiporter [Anaerohalosphaeraceae bacterium]HOM76213.1 cation:proton antiporter [Anaerohalosphaeraceae bacterium]HPC65155.1 cation:proton antiporter [Anaerohalosphaeraceae bacterium]HRS71383.1 cation:proton antiporter [Anaerohalosphaeraceae bacterium]